MRKLLDFMQMNKQKRPNNSGRPGQTVGLGSAECVGVAGGGIKYLLAGPPVGDGRIFTDFTRSRF
jgi:hypothetical protein